MYVEKYQIRYVCKKKYEMCYVCRKYQTRDVSNFFHFYKTTVQDESSYVTQIFRNGYQNDDGDCMIILTLNI